ncbi:MAG: ABC transporter substrate-binding protein [Betaproteobacteria bacterium]|nr:ABC transporter substrate-binding protein [Betaproteobacteria bacterium]
MRRGFSHATLLPLIAGAAFLLPGLAGADAPGVSATRVLVGESAAFTGPAAQLGIQMRDGMKLYFDHVNAQGGVYGRKIELITRDDRYEPKLAAENTHQLIEDDKVFALIGYVGTPTSQAALPIFTAAETPFIGPFTGADLLRHPFNRYVFNVRASYYDETDKIVQQLLTVGIKRFAVFYQNDAYGQAGLTGVQRAVKKRGGEIVATGTVERNTVDVGKAVKDIAPKQPDAVIMISAYNSIAAFVRQMKKLDYAGEFLNVSFVGSTALAKELGEEGRGVVISQVVPFPWGEATPVIAEFNALAAQAKVDVNFSSVEGYLVAKVFVEGLRRAGKNLTREGLIRALETMTNYDLGGFTVNFSPTDHNGSTFVDLTIITRNEKFLH